MNSICVFCGSKFGVKPSYKSAAVEVGRLLAARKINLVYGGGNVGLMGVVADSTMESGGHVIGVIPRSMADKEVAHRGISQLHIVDSMHQRKAMMSELADGFIALPGGYGTLEELCEIVTWFQLGLHHKPCGILNVDGYFDGLLSQFDVGVSEGFIRPQHRELILSGDDPTRLIDQLLTVHPPIMDKWINRSET